MKYIYSDGDSYKLITAESPEEALRLIWHHDLDSEDGEMMRISPFTLTEITLGQAHQVEFTLKPAAVEMVINRSTPVGPHLARKGTIT